MSDHHKKSWLTRLLGNPFAKWPRRRVRPLCRSQLSEDMRQRPHCINQHLRQRGYTSGDKVVVMLESDFQRVIEVAQSKTNKGALHTLMLFTLHSERLEKTAHALREPLTQP